MAKRYKMDDDELPKLLRIVPKSARGNPARVDGVPVWSVSDPTILLVEPAPDGLTATLTALGPQTPPDAPVQVSVEADVDTGLGVVLVVGRLDVDVVGGKATVVDIEVGIP